MENREQDVIEQLLPKLEEYLLVQGVQIHGSMFKCINPEHDDKDPSCSLSGAYNRTVFHCFGSCQIAGNIFTAAHFLEGLPMHGPEFFSQTLVSLCTRYNIDYTPRELDENQKEAITYRRAHQDASEILRNFVKRDWEKDVPHVKIIKDRGISLASVEEFGVGAIPSTEEYVKMMTSCGWSKSFLIENHLLDPDTKEDKIFVPDKIIMTVKDYYGRPIAFVARAATWSKGCGYAKYVNSPGSAVYTKADTLFGLDLAKKAIKKDPLFIVEGYIDVIALRQAGIKNVAGLGSADFGDAIANTIDAATLKRGFGRAHRAAQPDEESAGEAGAPKERRADLPDSDWSHDIIFAFDGDDAGTECTKRALEKLATRSDITVRIKQLPNLEGCHDPDEILRKHGVAFFNGLEVYSAFKWIQKFRDTTLESEEVFLRRICKEISKSDSPIERRSKVRDIADLVKNYTIDDIMGQIDEERGRTNSKMHAQMAAALEEMYKRQRTAVGVDLINLVSETHAKLRAIEKDYRVRKENPHIQCLKVAEEIRTNFAKSDRKLNGFTIPSFPKLSDALDGFPDHECLVTIAGDSNLGKSTLVREISWDIAKNNPDAVVGYMSIDDSEKDVLQALVAREADLPRRKVYKYGYLKSQGEVAVPTLDCIDQAWDFVMRQCEKNYIIFDSTQGSTIMHLEDHIGFMRKSFPGKKPILFLDNFHKLRTTDVVQEMRAKFVDFSHIIKDITQLEDIPIVMTVEIRKTENKWPDLRDIAETKQIEYDSKIILTLYQDMHYNPETKVRWIRDKELDEEMNIPYMPYLECMIAKNKHTEKKCRLGYRFETDKSHLWEVDYSEIEAKHRDRS